MLKNQKFWCLEKVANQNQVSENWHIGEQVLEIVDQFTYLYVLFLITKIILPKQKSSCLNKVGKHLKEIAEICV